MRRTNGGDRFPSRFRAILTSNFFVQNFLFFFPQEQKEKEENEDFFSKFGNYFRGEKVWKASHSTLWKKIKMEKTDIQKIAEKRIRILEF